MFDLEDYQRREERAIEIARELLAKVERGELDEKDCENLQGGLFYYQQGDSVQDCIQRETFSFFIRRYYVARLFFLATRQWFDSVARLVTGKKVVEVCAGAGLVAKVMKARGLDWTATDLDPPDDAVTKVLKLDAVEAVKTLNPDVIFSSWFPLGNPIDKAVADLGVPMIIEGEYDAATGSGAFFEAYCEQCVGAEDTIEGFIDCPRFSGINDYTMLVNWK